MKKIFLLLCLCIPLCSMAQKEKADSKYLAGAVPVKDGKVVFEHEYSIPGKSADQIYDALLAYGQSLVKEENSLPQSRISTNDKANGLIAINMEEWLYFRKTAWVTNRTRFYYQLLYQVKDGGFSVTMRNIQYIYDEERDQRGGIQYKAEEWITDDIAIQKDGKRLSRLNGKFRTFTIDRKDILFSESYYAAGGQKKKIKKIIEIEVDEDE